jgi:hypothetical protein
MQLGGLFYAAKLLRFVNVPVPGVLGLLLYRPRPQEAAPAAHRLRTDREEKA